MSQAIPFCTPVVYSRGSFTLEQTFYEWATSYTSVWNHKKIEVQYISQDSEGRQIECGKFSENTPSLFWTCIKILSFCLVLLLIAAAIIQAVHQAKHRFRLISKIVPSINEEKERAKVISDETTSPKMAPIPLSVVQNINFGSSEISSPSSAPSLLHSVSRQSTLGTFEKEQKVTDFQPFMLTLHDESSPIKIEIETVAARNDCFAKIIDAVTNRLIIYTISFEGANTQAARQTLIDSIDSSFKHNNEIEIIEYENVDAKTIILKPKIIKYVGLKEKKYANGAIEVKIDYRSFFEGHVIYHRQFLNGTLEVGCFSEKTNALLSGYRKTSDGRETFHGQADLLSILNTDNSLHIFKVGEVLIPVDKATGLDGKATYCLSQKKINDIVVDFCLTIVQKDIQKLKEFWNYCSDSDKSAFTDAIITAQTKGKIFHGDVINMLQAW